MLEKRTLVLACSLLSASMLNAYDLKNPALSPVDFKEAPKHETLKLVENGELKFAIIADMNAEKDVKGKKTIPAAVAVICEAFEKCAGKKPEVFAPDKAGEAAAKYPYRLLVGKSAATDALGIDVFKLPVQGFEVRTFKDGIAVAGYDSNLMPGYNSHPLDKLGVSQGTLYGAYDFIERFLGCRFFFPGDYGSIWPSIKDLAIAPVDYTDYPRFNTRSGNYYIVSSINGEKNLKYWSGFLGENIKTADASLFCDRWRFGGTEPGGGSHDPRPEKLAAAYPDKLETIFYRSPDGNFYYNDKQHIGNYYNVLDLAFADLIVNSWKKFYASEGKDNDGWDGINNTYMSFGVCDTKMALQDMEHHPLVEKLNLITEVNRKRGCPLADVYARFLQYLGQRAEKELPGKRIFLLAYYDVEMPSLDPRWKLPDNFEIRLCPGAMPSKTVNAKAVADTRRLVEEWKAATGRPVAAMWLYNARTNTFGRAMIGEFAGDVPKVMGDAFGRKEMFFDHDGSDDLWHFYCAAYAAYRSMWNPDFNVDAAIDEHWAPFYGAAAAPSLQKFHRLLKDNYIAVTKQDKAELLFPLEVINELDSLLKKAEQAIAPDSVEMRRFKVFVAPWPKALEASRNRINYERPVYKAHQLIPGEEIKLDGKATDAVWAKIPAVPLIDPIGSNLKPKFPATAKFAWDANGIYGMVDLPYPPLADPAKSIWSNDSIELFISPGMSKETNFQFVFDGVKNIHLGTQRLLPIPQPYDGYWKAPGFKLEMDARKDGWTAEFFIAFKDMQVPAPKAYDSWLFNLVRNKLSEPKEYLSSAMTLGNNHNIPMYGVMKFNGKGE